MQGLLHWLLASPLRSGLAAAALALSRLFDIFGAALIALVALRKGTVAALNAAAFAVPLLLAASYFGGSGILLPIAVFGLWMPVILLSAVLRNTGSLAVMLQAGAAAAGLVLAAWYTLDTDPLGTVSAFLDAQLLPLLESMGNEPGALNADQHAALARIAPGMMAAGSLLVVALAIVAGRWWQAIAFNPGGFRRDFHRLRHGRTVALAAAVLVLAASITGQPVLNGFALAGAVALIFQGIAMVHGVIAATGQPGLWLWGMYGLLLLLPLPATVLLAVAGGLDNWMDFRRLAKGAADSNE